MLLPETCNNQIHSSLKFSTKWRSPSPDCSRQRDFLHYFPTCFIWMSQAAWEYRIRAVKTTSPPPPPLCTVNRASADTRSASYRGISSSTPKCSPNCIQVTFKILLHPNPNLSLIPSDLYIQQTNRQNLTRAGDKYFLSLYNKWTAILRSLISRYFS